MELRDYQLAGVEDAVQFVGGGGQRRCYAAPTGTGKSVVEVAVLQRLKELGREPLLVTPRLEIVEGILDKAGVRSAGLSENKLAELGLRHRVTTPIRARNRLFANTLGFWPDVLLIDEAHHSPAFSYQELSALAGRQVLGFTASPYRGTPRGTKDFLDYWGEPRWLITLKDAASRGVLAFPHIKFVPLVDDDEIDVVAGEFKVRSSDALASRFGELADRLAVADRRPSLLVVPNRASAADALAAFEHRGLAADAVLGTTPAKARREMFARCLAAESTLISVGVVSEGVDLPIRRVVDMSPTMSPVVFVQRLGRGTRPLGPGEAPPELWMCCRNLERHAYLLEGVLPGGDVVQSQQVFGGPSRRGSARVVGLEGIGRFRPVPVPLSSGAAGALYSLRVSEGSEVREYVLLLHPSSPTPTVATRVNGSDESGGRRYGRWKRIPSIPDLTGAVAGSTPSGDLTPKMQDWWARSASHFGLDGSAQVNRKQFQALPILADLREKFV